MWRVLAHLADPLHVAAFRSDETASHLELLVVRNLDVKATCVLDTGVLVTIHAIVVIGVVRLLHLLLGRLEGG